MWPEARVACPQSGTSSAGVNQRRPYRAGSAVFSRKAVSAWLFSAASACMRPASGHASNGSTTQAGLPLKGSDAKASMVHWRMGLLRRLTDWRGEAAGEAVADRRPLVADNREVDRIPQRAVAAHHVGAEHAFAGRAQLGDGGLGAKVATVGLQLDAVEAERLESVAQQRELAGRIDLGRPDLGRVPGVADLQPAVRRLDGKVARAADDRAVGAGPDRPDGLPTGQRQVERLIEPGVETGARRGRRHVLPDLRQVGGVGQTLAMLLRQWLEADGAGDEGGAEIGEGEHCHGAANGISTY